MITSTSNPQLKDIRKLRDKKYRVKSGLAWVEGLRACGDAFTKPENIQTLIYCPETLRGDYAEKLLSDAENNNVHILDVSESAFSSLSEKDNPSGIGLVVLQKYYHMEDVNLGPGDLWIALDRIADPGNLGTIMRTIDACGGRGIILIDHCTDPYDPTAIRASTGALFHLKIVKAESQDFISWKKGKTLKLVGAVAVPDSLDYHSYQYPNPVMLILGSEREGLHPDLTAVCDQLVNIPMVGHVDSLNLAEASAIVMYEVFNQFRYSGKIAGER